MRAVKGLITSSTGAAIICGRSRRSVCAAQSPQRTAEMDRAGGKWADKGSRASTECQPNMTAEDACLVPASRFRIIEEYDPPKLRLDFRTGRKAPMYYWGHQSSAVDPQVLAKATQAALSCRLRSEHKLGPGSLYPVNPSRIETTLLHTNHPRGFEHFRPIGIIPIIHRDILEDCAT